MQAGPVEAVTHFMRPGHRMTRRVETFPKLIIAAVNGLAFGGGCDLLESTHVTFTADTATFSKAGINIGIIPAFGGTRRLPHNVGRKAMPEPILSDRTFDAPEAARLGPVNRVIQAADLLDATPALATDLAFTADLATEPPLKLAAALLAIHHGMDAAIDDGLAIEEAAFAHIVPTHDAQEGVAASLKNAPQSSSVARP